MKIGREGRGCGRGGAAATPPNRVPTCETCRSGGRVRGRGCRRRRGASAYLEQRVTPGSATTKPGLAGRSGMMRVLSGGRPAGGDGEGRSEGGQRRGVAAGGGGRAGGQRRVGRPRCWRAPRRGGRLAARGRQVHARGARGAG